jgi:3-deoxy-D-manno-octulosonic-acid transferase
VGGGFATGLHNTLEPAVFGIPVIIGPNYKGFKEAEDLVTLGGIRSISNKESLTKTINELSLNKDKRISLGKINASYISKSKGATTKIMKDITNLLHP